MANKIQHTSATPREFTFELLKQITDNFSEEHVIGRGGCGVVYKGLLHDGEEIALKKLHYIPGLDDKQFMNEFNNLMRAQHPNIIRLVGYCSGGHERFKHNGEYIFARVQERILCFEYLQGGSLDKHISDESCGLDWNTRFKIIKGVSKGINYLHNGCKDPIYHLDLKPENILLDKNLVPKIGDFGLSRLFQTKKRHITSTFMGTMGYMPPEYIKRLAITPKFDVFSFGVIIIRIVAGYEGYSKCEHMSPREFLEHVHGNWRKRMQETMASHISEQVMTCIEIAFRCVEFDREKRPTMADIVNELDKIDTADKFKHNDESCGLDWNTRFKIIKGVSEGINYLHNGCKDSIYHLDLKPENILLDKNLVPKIGDFGLSRHLQTKKTHFTSTFMGTMGYMPPEYIDRRAITPKFDVFSLGVIIIRIVAGYEGYSKCEHMSPREFLEHVRKIFCIMHNNPLSTKIILLRLNFYGTFGHCIPPLQVHGNWRKRMQETVEKKIICHTAFHVSETARSEKRFLSGAFAPKLQSPRKDFYLLRLPRTSPKLPRQIKQPSRKNSCEKKKGKGRN